MTFCWTGDGAGQDKDQADCRTVTQLQSNICLPQVSNAGCCLVCEQFYLLYVPACPHEQCDCVVDLMKGCTCTDDWYLTKNEKSKPTCKSQTCCHGIRARTPTALISDGQLCIRLLTRALSFPSLHATIPQCESYSLTCAKARCQVSSSDPIRQHHFKSLKDAHYLRAAGIQLPVHTQGLGPYLHSGCHPYVSRSCSTTPLLQPNPVCT